MSAGRILAIVFAGVAFIGVVSWAGIEILGRLSKAAVVAVAEQHEEQDRQDPSLFDVRLGDRVGRHRQVTGTVRNNGEHPIAFVKVRCALKDWETKRELDAGITYAVGSEGLPPGEQRDFDLHLDGSRVGYLNHEARCQIVGFRRR
jgi:hypothetical protein